MRSDGYYRFLQSIPSRQSERRTRSSGVHCRPRRCSPRRAVGDTDSRQTEFSHGSIRIIAVHDVPRMPTSRGPSSCPADGCCRMGQPECARSGATRTRSASTSPIGWPRAPIKRSASHRDLAYRLAYSASFSMAALSPGHSASTARHNRSASSRSPRSVASAARLRRVTWP